MGYTHLSQSKRYQIQRQYKAGLSRRQIAEGMGRDTTTISRELRRNAGVECVYTAPGRRTHTHRGGGMGSGGRQAARAVEPRADRWLRAVAVISHERIYQHIAEDRQHGGTLWRELRRRKTRCGAPRERQRFRGRRIQERPADVEKRWRVGDWEGDTIAQRGW